jgi:hypothetical protein
MTNCFEYFLNNLSPIKFSKTNRNIYIKIKKLIIFFSFHQHIFDYECFHFSDSFSGFHNSVYKEV